MNRVWMFIDGYNFYYSVGDKDKLSRSQGTGSKIHLGWCDFRILATDHMLRHFGARDVVLDKIMYFTAPVPRSLETTADESERQAVWLRGVRSIDGIEIIEGVHKPEGRARRKEKMTNVKIALELVLGSVDGRFDAAILLCNDADQAPAVKAVKEGRAGQPKPVHVWTLEWQKRVWDLSQLDPDQKHVLTEQMLEKAD